METGGLADKFGNRYERDWAVDQLLGFLDGDVRFVVWEPLGPDDGGIDLRVGRADGWEAHQVKRSNRSEGKWTVRELGSRGVLKASFRAFNDGAQRFVFVSRDFTVLRELAERATAWDGVDPIDFVERRLTNHLRAAFRDLCQHWLDVEIDRSDGSSWPRSEITRVLQLLPRFEYDQGIGTVDQERRLAARIRLLVETDSADAVVDRIASFAFEHLGRPIFVDGFREFLRDAGYPPLDLHSDPRVDHEIERHQRLLERKFAPGMISGRLLPRPESEEILDLVLADDGPRVVWVHGSGGCGKSGVLVEVARELKSRGVPYFPLRWDNQKLPSGSLRKFSRETLELPATPHQCLLHQAAERRCVLLVDQLDALRWTHAHSGDVWEASGDLLEDASALANLRLVVACRTFDLDDNPQIKRWETILARHGDADSVSQRVEIGDLPDDLVAEVIGERGGSYVSYSDRQRALLRHAQSLALWCHLAEGEQGSPVVESRSDLMKRFWDACLNAAPGQLRSRLEEFLDTLTDYMSRHGAQLAPSILVSDSEAEAFLGSQGVLIRLDSNQLTFTHQSYLDYLVAAKVAREAIIEGRSVTDWVRSAEQSLFRREQLRQLLELLRDQEPPKYIETLRGLLFEDGIRFHLRHLVLTWLRAAETPRADEIAFVTELLDNEDWRSKVWGRTVLPAVAWFDALHEVGLWERWLASDSEPEIARCISIIRARYDGRSKSITKLLEPYLADPEWIPHIAAVLPFTPDEDTETLFEWRLEHIRHGILGIDWFYEEKRVEKRPRWALRLTHALIEAGRLNLETSLGRKADFDPALTAEQVDHLADIAGLDAHYAWDLFSDLFIDLWKDMSQSHEAGRRLYFSENRLGGQSGEFSLWLTATILRSAGRTLVEEDLQAFIATKIEPWRTSRQTMAPPVRWVAIGAMQAAPTASADFAVDWLLSSSANLVTQLFLDVESLNPAIGLISRLSPFCSDGVYRLLEDSILDFTPASEWQEAVWRARTNLEEIERNHDKIYLHPNSIGRTQLGLLQALPKQRQSIKARERLRVLARKFGNVHEESPKMLVGSVKSALPQGRLALFSDSHWLNLARSELKVTSQRWDGKSFLESSHEMFSQDFEQCARREPERFIHLAKRLTNCWKPWTPHYIRGLFNAFTFKKGEPEPPWTARLTQAIEDLIDNLNEISKLGGLESAICGLVERRADQGWSKRAVSLIANTARSHPEPDSSYEFQLMKNTEDSVRLAVVPTAGRAAATSAISALLRANPALLTMLEPAIKSVTTDSHLAVRHVAKRLCHAIWTIDPDRSIDLLLKVCDYHDDQILLFERIFQFAWWHDAGRLEPLVRRMLASPYQAVQQSAAELVTVGFVIEGSKSEIFRQCLTHEGRLSNGVGKALTRIFHEREDYRDICWTLIEEHFQHDHHIWLSLARVPAHCKELLATDWGPKLFNAALEAQPQGALTLRPLQVLKDLDAPLRPYVKVFANFIRCLRQTEAADFNRVRWRFHELPTLLLRLYGEVEQDDEETRTLCLGLWDELLESNLGDRLTHDLDRLDAEY